eukprot:Gb_00072 [translate_table: standard]
MPAQRRSASPAGREDDSEGSPSHSSDKDEYVFFTVIVAFRWMKWVWSSSSTIAGFDKQWPLFQYGITVGYGCYRRICHVLLRGIVTIGCLQIDIWLPVSRVEWIVRVNCSHIGHPLLVCIGLP